VQGFGDVSDCRKHKISALLYNIMSASAFVYCHRALALRAQTTARENYYQAIVLENTQHLNDQKKPRYRTRSIDHDMEKTIQKEKQHPDYDCNAAKIK
jgi:hypothetical protein